MSRAPKPSIPDLPATGLPVTAVPQGGAAFFPDVAAKKRHVEARVLSTFSGWGYREVVPPLFEYLDILSRGLAPDVVARGYKIEDRKDGRLMVIRPDVTAQVARMAAARKDDPAVPHRYGYATNVYTQQEAHRGRPREVFQVGAERLGPGGVAADVEIVSLLISTLRELGLSGFVVAMGQAGYFQAILDGMDLPDGASRELTRAVARKDAASIRTVLTQAGVATEQIDALTQIPFLIGGTEVFAAARKLTRSKEAVAALDHLEAVVAGLAECGMGEHVLVDLGEIRDLNYYTGLVFEALVPDVGFELGGGGRYDGLMGRFGHPMDATGFALDVERVMEAMSRASVAVAVPCLDYVVTGDLPAAHQLAARLREAGLSVVTGLTSEADGAAQLTVQGDGWILSAPGRKPEAVSTDLDALVARANKGGR